MTKPIPLTRAEFSYFDTISTRWSDNDVYGHVNNVQYYSYFDTAVNRYLIDHCKLDIHAGAVIGLVVHSSCDYFAPAAFPQALRAGVRVLRLGNASVRYQVGIFADSGQQAIAQGEFVHVYVDAVTRTPAGLTDAMRAGLEKLVVGVP